jgi:phytoene dehydrogenase-like protein
VGRSFRSWLLNHMNRPTAEAIVGLLLVVTYDHDPGRLSAAFMHERLRRSMSDVVRFVLGGFGTLIDGLAERATQLGVEMQTRTPVRGVEGPPRSTLIATSLDSARKITGTLDWPSGRDHAARPGPEG